MNDLKFNLNSIKSYKNTFISSKNYYTNTSYSTYTSSYLKYCSQSDSTVAKMVKNLDSCYSGITSSYLNILSWWNNFILNIEGIENTIKGGPQTISDSSLKSYINIAFQSLPNLNVTGNSSFSSIDQSKLSNIFSNNLDKKDDAIEEAKKKDTKDKIKSYLKNVFSINNINDKEETKELTEDEEYAIYIEKLCSTKLSKIEATHDEMNELIKALVAVQVGQTNFTEEQQSEILKYLEKNNKDYYSYVENPLDTPKSVATNMLMSAASALGYVDVNEDESLADSFKNVGASIGTAVTGVVEGVADFLTDVGATLEYGAAAVLSIGTGVYDLYQCIDSNITGEDKVYITPEVWKSALEINSENKKTNDELGNSFYDDTTVGQALKDNASNFENIRNISSQFGYEASIVALSILSGGLAGAASGTAATATTTAKSVTSIAMGASAATASFGKHSTEAYTSGAGVGESLAYGAGNAAIDYLTHWGGAKVNGISVMAGESGLSNIMNSIARVSVDAAAAGAEYTARTGLQSAFIGDKTFAEQWDANGGWSGFGQTVLTAGAFSAFGEIMDNISKVISNKKNIIEARNNDPALTAEELNLKMDEYNRLTSIENSKEYIDYINKKNNNIDVVPNKEFDELANKKSKLYNELSKYEESFSNESNLFETDDTIKSNQLTDENLNLKNEIGDNVDPNKISQKTYAGYNGNLKNYIFDNMPEGLNDLEKARYIYLKINSELSYSPGWIGSRNKYSELYHQHFDISNMPSDEIICSNWAQIYSDLLNEAGIKNNIRGLSNEFTHKWVVFEVDNRFFLADPTNTYRFKSDITNLNDLDRIQLGIETKGFVEILPECATSDTFSNDLFRDNLGDDYFQKLIDFSEENLKEIDAKLGYNYSELNKLFDKNKNSSAVLKRLGLTKNSTIEDIVAAKFKTDILPKIDELGNVEAMKGYKILKNKYLLRDEQDYIMVEFLVDPDGKVVSVYNLPTETYLHAGKGKTIKIDEDFFMHPDKYGYKIWKN